jgi:hypothetical protein
MPARPRQSGSGQWCLHNQGNGAAAVPVPSAQTCVTHPTRLPVQDWSVRTENPWEANLFYVPALTYFYSSGCIGRLQGEAGCGRCMYATSTCRTCRLASPLPACLPASKVKKGCGAVCVGEAVSVREAGTPAVACHVLLIPAAHGCSHTAAAAMQATPTRGLLRSTPAMWCSTSGRCTPSGTGQGGGTMCSGSRWTVARARWLAAASWSGPSSWCTLQ